LVLELWLGDYAGNVLGAKCSYKMQSLEPDIDEIVAASEAVIFCKDVGFRDVIMEGDALNVVKEINSAPPYLSRLGHFYSCVQGSQFCNTYSSKGSFSSLSRSCVAGGDS